MRSENSRTFLTHFSNNEEEEEELEENKPENDEKPAKKAKIHENKKLPKKSPGQRTLSGFLNKGIKQEDQIQGQQEEKEVN